MEPFAHGGFLVSPESVKGLELVGEVAAFQVEDAAGFDVASDSEFVAGKVGDFGQGHDRSASDDVELVFHLLGTFVFSHHVIQPYGVFHGVHHGDFLAGAVNEVELGLGKHDGQGDAGKPSASAEIHDFHAWKQLEILRYGEGVKHMMLIKVVHVLSGDDIDLAIPVQI